MATKREELEMAAQGKGCLGKAAEDEPVFILRAQDKLAAMLVRVWATSAHRCGCPDEKVAEARALAAHMDAWPTRKFPD
jgi:hypothetical protein